jgi:hypothetical protein
MMNVPDLQSSPFDDGLETHLIELANTQDVGV